MAGADPFPSQPLSYDAALELLATGEIDVKGLLPRSSNYTFLVTVTANGVQALAVYKPRRGERPLWDFPPGTLAQREVAAYVVSEALGWSLVPPTLLRDGPQGPGMIQLYVDADPQENYFTLRDHFQPQFQRMALLDAVINNADRKAGHCLRDGYGHIWGIDHGVCFHEDTKLRTVIWDFAGSKVPASLVHDLKDLHRRLESDSDPFMETLHGLLSRREIDALGRRTGRLIQEARFPQPDLHGRHIPWPIV